MVWAPYTLRVTVRVRPLDEPDYEPWRRLWEGYLDFYRVELSGEVTQATWRRLLSPEDDIHGLAATVGIDGDLVGIVHFLFHPVTWSVATRCYLEDLYVAEHARGSGAGRRLIEAVYDAADARGADQVYWLTEEDNHPARRLYDRVGQLTRFVKYRR